MLILRAISNLPLDYVESKKTLTIRAISVKRNYTPKFIVKDKLGNPIVNANININNTGDEYDFVTDESGYAEVNGTVPRNELYDVIVTATGYQTITSTILLPLGFKENTTVLFKVNSLITTSHGYAVNLNPTDPENREFN